jgi:hypothetical protein
VFAFVLAVVECCDGLALDIPTVFSSQLRGEGKGREEGFGF